MDIDFVLSDLHPVTANQCLHLTLLFAELVDDKTQVSVDLVVPSKGAVHFVGINTQVHDLLLSGSNRTFQLLDLEVQYIFELL